MTRAAVALLAALAFAPASFAQPGPTMPSDEQLDALLARRDWNALGAALSNPADRDDLARSMQWLRSRVEAGGGAFLGYIYARNAWLIGDQIKVDDPNTDLRVTAAIMTLYTYEIVQIAGTRCEDQSVPPQRIAQLLATEKPALDFIAKQRPATKSLVLDAAMALERRTAVLRDDDDLVCRPNPVAAQQPAPAPRYVDKKTSQAREAGVRTEMRASLTKLVNP